MFAALPRPAARLLAGVLLASLLAAWPGARKMVRAQAGCEASTISAPRAGDRLRGPVEVLGSASIEGFNFYKVEWAALGDPQQWIAVSQVVDRPVRNGRLDTWPTSTRSDGPYRLKLTVVDDSFGERCSFIVEDLRLANESEPATLEPDKTNAWPTAPATAPSAAESPATATVTPDQDGQVAPVAPVASSTLEATQIDEPPPPPAGSDSADEGEAESAPSDASQDDAESSAVAVADGTSETGTSTTPAATERATLEPVIPKSSPTAALPPGMGRTFTAGLLLAVLAGLGLAVLLLRR